MLILNTRPKERAAALTQDLMVLGYQVQEFPLLELIALPLDTQLQQQFIDFQAASIVVVVSSIAVDIGMQYYQDLGYSLATLQHKTWIAVGQSTQKTLQKYGIDSVCPEVENSEGMLQLPMLKHVADQTIAFWRGHGGRLLMLQHAQQQGCQVLNMLLYARQQPVYALHELMQHTTQKPIIVLLSSEQSWNNWRDLIIAQTGKWQHLTDYHYVVLGDRVTQTVREYFQAHVLSSTVLTVYRLNAEHIHQQLQQYYRYE